MNRLLGFFVLIALVNCAWVSKKALENPEARSRLKALTVGDHIYALGGRFGAELTVNQRYNPATDNWESLRPTPLARAEFGAVVVDQSIFVWGGGYGTEENIDVYFPRDNSWIRLANGLAQSNFGSVYYGGLVYSIGGDCCASSPVSTVQTYSPSNPGAWAPGVNLPNARAGAATVILDGSIYVIGGRSSNGGSSFLNSVVVFDPQVGYWTSRAPMRTGRADFSAAVIDGIIYVFGGRGSGGELDSVEYFDPEGGGQWRAGDEPMPTARFNYALSVVNGVAFVIGGETDLEAWTGVVEAYRPSVWLRKNQTASKL